MAPAGSPAPSLHVYQRRARFEVVFHGHDELDLDPGPGADAGGMSDPRSAYRGNDARREEAEADAMAVVY
ncbi:hypothetical protein GUJ93_ZPchr0009g1172 [Zizania palustris]|uniref:Uncharacterized protein n=1 Tax=Zizania palustris TaxID=103762 RepID=A0A8J5RPJ1_ZIZPA|nr:hypothetical protein GUJ93_ZPchr0009g1172 [Zizania palustris]